MLSTLTRTLAAMLIGVSAVSSVFAKELPLDNVRSIAEEAYIYAYPMVRNYKTMYFRSIAGKKRGFNQFFHRHSLLDPSFKAIVGPNNDTLYSSSWLDLRSEPMVISVPEVPRHRYYSIQLIDMFTHNFAYIGQRATGNDAGVYVIARPNQKVSKSAKIDRIYRSETDFVFVIGRTLAKSGEDQKKAAMLQRQYQMQPLSEFLGKGKPKQAGAVIFPEFDPEKARGADFLNLFNFLLQFVDIHSSEKPAFERFGKIGVAAGQSSNFEQWDLDVQRAIIAGINEGHRKIAEESRTIGSQVSGWNTTFHGFGAREVMQGRLLLRAAAAMIALYGNSREENSSFSRQVDNAGRQLDGKKYSYTLHFKKGQLPPVDGFWSLTMYRLPEILLYENAIRRYSIGDRTPDLRYGSDGSLTLYLQHRVPSDPAKAANWLPAPAGPFSVALRNYLPRETLFNGKWLPPELIRTEFE